MTAYSPLQYRVMYSLIQANNPPLPLLYPSAVFPSSARAGAAISVNSAVWCNNVISLVKTSVLEEAGGGCSCCWAWCGAASCQLPPASAAAIVSLNWPRYHSVGTGRGLRFEIC